MMIKANLVHNNYMDQQWFKTQLKRVGKTQRDLAEAMGRDASVVSKMLAGHVTVSVQSVSVLATFLELSPVEVLSHLGFPELLGNADRFDRERLVYAIGGVLEWAKSAKENLDADELAEAMADFYEELGEVDPKQWKPAINHGMRHRTRQTRILKNKQTFTH